MVSLALEPREELAHRRLVGIELERAPQARRGFRRPAETEESDAGARRRRRIGGIERGGRLEIGQSAGAVASLDPETAAKDAQSCRVGERRDRAIEQPEAAPGLAALGVGKRAFGRRALAVRQAGVERARQQLVGAREVAVLEAQLGEVPQRRGELRIERQGLLESRDGLGAPAEALQDQPLVVERATGAGGGAGP